ncbi:MAG: ATPase [Myxococcota bacterium]
MIVRMARVLVMGPRRLLPDVLHLLQTLGTLQLRPLPADRPDGGTAGTPRGDAATQAELQRTIGMIEDTLGRLPRPGHPPQSVMAPEAPLQLEELQATIRALEERRAALEEERALLARYERLLVAIAPLLHELEGARHLDAVGVLVRRQQDTAALLGRELTRITGGAHALVLREIDEEHLAGLVTLPRELTPQLTRLLFERGIGEVKLPERYAGQPLAQGVKTLLARRRELADEIERCRKQWVSLGERWHGPLTAALREARNRLAWLRAAGLCAQTRHAFVVAGWVPVDDVAALHQALTRAHHGTITLLALPVTPAEYDAVPVVLKNPSWLRPFEVLLALQPLPRYGSLDPTPLLAVFFPLCFGLILADVGMGLTLLLLALVGWKRHWGGAVGRDVAAVALACAVSATGFGFLFGELFGDLGRFVGMEPILYNRRQAIIPLLGLVLVFGGSQLGLGLSLGVVTAWRAGERGTAGARLLMLAVLGAVASAAAAHRGLLPRELERGALLALGPLVALAVLTEGWLAPLEMLRTLGNVLSYSRLMAVGLASLLLAEVANQLAVAVRPAVLGVGLAVLLHITNFTLGLLSPIIQALRLQYVEFFDKFFVPGGKPYTPLSLAS